MAVHDRTLDEARLARQGDNHSMSLIEKIFYFEHQAGPSADNDNRDARTQTSACFNSWAMPDYMRK